MSKLRKVSKRASIFDLRMSVPSFTSSQAEQQHDLARGEKKKRRKMQVGRRR
jgi:hypothetical protein